MEDSTKSELRLNVDKSPSKSSSLNITMTGLLTNNESKGFNIGLTPNKNEDKNTHSNINLLSDNDSKNNVIISANKINSISPQKRKETYNNLITHDNNVSIHFASSIDGITDGISTINDNINNINIHTSEESQEDRLFPSASLNENDEIITNMSDNSNVFGGIQPIQSSKTSSKMYDIQINFSPITHDNNNDNNNDINGSSPTRSHKSTKQHNSEDNKHKICQAITHCSQNMEHILSMLNKYGQQCTCETNINNKESPKKKKHKPKKFNRKSIKPRNLFNDTIGNDNISKTPQPPKIVIYGFIYIFSVVYSEK